MAFTTNTKLDAILYTHWFVGALDPERRLTQLLQWP